MLEPQCILIGSSPSDCSLGPHFVHRVQSVPIVCQHYFFVTSNRWINHFDVDEYRIADTDVVQTVSALRWSTRTLSDVLATKSRSSSVLKSPARMTVASGYILY